jgi:hypothetical protein
MMEVFWIYAWLVWLSYIPALRWESTPLNLISCLALGVAVEIVVRLTLAGRWSLRKSAGGHTAQFFVLDYFDAFESGRRIRTV